MEHVERQEEREREIHSDVERLDARGDELEERAEELDKQIGETREEFKRKQQAEDVPGAQEAGGQYVSDDGPSPEADTAPGDSDGADDDGQATGNPPNDDAPAADE